MLYLAADHRGFPFKESIKKYLKALGYEYEDLGAKTLDPKDDYPDFGIKAVKKVNQEPQKNKAILFCGSGIGMTILANRFNNVRCAPVFNTQTAKMSREHNNANCLSLPADFLTEQQAEEIVKIWLETEFSGEKRHKRRLEKISKIQS